jgi:hypothetical protein
MSAIHNGLLVTGLALAVALTIAWDGLLAYGLIGPFGIGAAPRTLCPRQRRSLATGTNHSSEYSPHTRVAFGSLIPAERSA